MNQEVPRGCEGAPVWARLLHAAGTIEARLEETLAQQAELSMAKFGVLVVLAQSEQPLALSDLARKRSCVRSNVTQLVDRMEQEGLVERRRDDLEDRRSVKAVITAEGRRRFEAGSRALAEAERELFKSFNQDELDFLGRLLLRLAL